MTIYPLPVYISSIHRTCIVYPLPIFIYHFIFIGHTPSIQAYAYHHQHAFMSCSMPIHTTHNTWFTFFNHLFHYLSNHIITLFTYHTPLTYYSYIHMPSNITCFISIHNHLSYYNIHTNITLMSYIHLFYIHTSLYYKHLSYMWGNIFFMHLYSFYFS